MKLLEESHRLYRRARNVFPVINLLEINLRLIANTSGIIHGRRYLEIKMDTNNTCNLRCGFCNWNYKRLSQPEMLRFLSIDEFKKIADQTFYRAKSVYLSCNGEPFITKNFSKYIRIACSYGVPQIGFVTNATMITEEDVMTCVSEGVNIVHISIDASNPETYRKIRGADFERVIDVLRQFKRYKLEQKKNIPQINVNYTLFTINSEELLPFIKKYGEFIDCIRVGLYMKRHEELPFDRPDPNTARRVINDARRLCESENIEFHAAYETKSATRKRLCPVPLSYININSRGEVRLCSQEVIGNLLERDSYIEIEKRNLSKIKDLIHMKNQHCQAHCYSS